MSEVTLFCQIIENELSILTEDEYIEEFLEIDFDDYTELNLSINCSHEYTLYVIDDLDIYEYKITQMKHFNKYDESVMYMLKIFANEHNYVPFEITGPVTIDLSNIEVLLDKYIHNRIVLIISNKGVVSNYLLVNPIKI